MEYSNAYKFEICGSENLKLEFFFILFDFKRTIFSLQCFIVYLSTWMASANGQDIICWNILLKNIYFSKWMLKWMLYTKKIWNILLYLHGVFFRKIGLVWKFFRIFGLRLQDFWIDFTRLFNHYPGLLIFNGSNYFLINYLIRKINLI